MCNESGIGEISNQLDALFSDSVVEEKSEHPRLALYKNHGRATDQERRWRQKLAQLTRTFVKAKQFDENRGLHLHSTEPDVRPKDVDSDSPHPWASKPQNYRGSSWRRYSLNLMLAEWLLFLPPQFSEHYLMKLCPKGRHVLVVAAKGTTKVISRTGKLLLSTISRLPGGGLGQSYRQNEAYCTMLDCIMLRLTDDDPKSSIGDATEMDVSTDFSVEFMVMDVLRFRGTSYSNLPCRERCTWLGDYLRDAIEEYIDEDPVRFKVAPSHSCNIDSMSAVFSQKPDTELDGVLFYHEAAIYEPGATPLVCWLKPYMLPEWFPDLKLHPDFMLGCPPDYTTYLEEIRLEEKERRKRRHSKDPEPASSLTNE